jgi:hypothetical protein
VLGRELTSGRLVRDLSELNARLRAAQWPVLYSVAGGRVVCG